MPSVRSSRNFYSCVQPERPLQPRRAEPAISRPRKDRDAPRFTRPAARCLCVRGLGGGAGGAPSRRWNGGLGRRARSSDPGRGDVRAPLSLVWPGLLAVRAARSPAPPPSRPVPPALRTPMVISAELHAQILRYYHVEKWRAGTIARQIGVHRDVVARVLAQSGLPAHGPMQRSMRIDLPAVHPEDPRGVADPDRGPALRHGL